MNSSEPRKDRFAPLTYEQMYGVEEPEPDAGASSEALKLLEIKKICVSLRA